MHIAADNMWLVAAVWMTLAFFSSIVSIRVKLAAALVEIIVGVLAGNLLGLQTNAWIDFVSGFGAIMLTFLAGAEIDPVVLREQARPAAAIGAASFFAPFLAAMAYAYFGLHWTVPASKIAGIAMSTTSVAVVYAVMLESGLADKKFGQLVLAACFITDLGTVVALGLLFANFNGWLALLILAIPFSMFCVPRLLRFTFARVGERVSQPGLRLVFAIVLVLSAIATAARSEGVLPAYFLGLACAGFLFANKAVAKQLRGTTMSLLTPFYFLKAGTLVSFGGHDRDTRNRRLLRRQVAREDRGGSPHHACLRLWGARSELYHLDDGDRPHVRDDIEPLRPHPSLHRSISVYDPRNRRDPHGDHPHVDRAGAVPSAPPVRRR